MTRRARRKKWTFYVPVMRNQTVKLIRYGRGGNTYRRSCYVAA